MLLKDFRPQSKLVTKSTRVLVPRYPVIDAHNHLGEDFGGGWINRPVNELIDLLDEAGVRTYVDLDGGWGEDVLISHIEKFKNPYPDRFMVFGGVNWNQWKSLGEAFPEWAAGRLKIQKEVGAEGLKIWKNFGLKVSDHKGDLVQIDDTRLDPIWSTASELNLPVMIHVADPVAFFDPLDEANERWEELQAHPDWQFPSPPCPPFTSILDGLANLVEWHPKTIFIGAHVGCYAENLSWVGGLMEKCPNFFVDISARIGELGRQPYSARQFFINYSDRILFGSDFGPDLEAYQLAYRFLETDDEYFNYNTSEVPLQGRWYVYGINLPDEVLQKVYYSNAERLLVNGKKRENV
jgi:predicted TIM-barrel fold metal-dependent hydrolase